MGGKVRDSGLGERKAGHGVSGSGGIGDTGSDEEPSENREMEAWVIDGDW